MTARTPEQWADQMLNQPLALGDEYGNLLISLGVKEQEHRSQDERHDDNDGDDELFSTTPDERAEQTRTASTTTTSHHSSTPHSGKVAGSTPSPSFLPPTPPYRLFPLAHQRTDPLFLNLVRLTGGAELKPACTTCHARKIRCDLGATPLTGGLCSPCRRAGRGDCRRHRRKGRGCSPLPRSRVRREREGEREGEEEGERLRRLGEELRELGERMVAGRRGEGKGA